MTALTPTAERIIIPLTQNQAAIIDVQDYDMIMSFNRSWYAWKSRNTFYAGCKVRGKLIIMHRVIADAQPSDIVDHRDRCGLHNWRDNLIITNHSGNMKNKGIYRNNTTGITGVYPCCDRHGNFRWAAQITHNKRQRLLGRFKTFEAAVDARLNAQKELGR